MTGTQAAASTHPPVLLAVDVPPTDLAALGCSGEGAAFEVLCTGTPLAIPDDRQVGAVLLGTSDLDRGRGLVRELRSAHATALAPIYATDEALAGTAGCDGAPPADLPATVTQFATRSAALPLHPETSFEQRAVAYLYLLPGRSLVPVKTVSAPGIYRYEPLEAWPDAPNIDAWLRTASRDGLIQADELVNRLRQCRACNGAHLNYVDTCPGCQSIDIAAESALHCFNCGHVGLEEQFLRHHRLECPNCNTALRHIGTDYDRPIENQVCRACGQMFIDATVVADCLDCGHRNGLDELVQRRVSRYVLGPAGRMLAQYGPAYRENVPARGEALPPAHFLWLLDWLSAVPLPKGSSHIVIALLFPNLRDMQERAADQAVGMHLDEAALQLRSLLTDGETFTRHGEILAFVCLPFSSSRRAEALTASMKEVMAAQVRYELEARIETRALPSSARTFDAAQWLDGFADELAQ